MARLPIVDPGQLPAAVAAKLASLPAMNTFGTFAHAQTALAPWADFARALLTETELDPVLREIAILRVAALSPGASYEWDQHEAIARQVGATEQQIEGARTGAGLTGDDALIARFTEEVVRDVQPAQATWDAAHALLGAREIVELLFVIGNYMMVARLLVTLRIEDDPPAGAGLFDAPA